MFIGLTFPFLKTKEYLYFYSSFLLASIFALLLIEIFPFVSDDSKNTFGIFVFDT